MQDKLINIIGVLSIGLSFLLIGLGLDEIIGKSFFQWLSSLIDKYQILIAGGLAILAALINSRAVTQASALPYQKKEAEFLNSARDTFAKIQSIAAHSVNRNPPDLNNELLTMKEKINLGNIVIINEKAGEYAAKTILLIDALQTKKGVSLEKTLEEIKNSAKSANKNLI